MGDYAKCPQCELNYMLVMEKCCSLCRPEMQGKTLADYEVASEDYRFEKKTAREKQMQALEAFRAYRWDRKPKY